MRIASDPDRATFARALEVMACLAQGLSVLCSLCAAHVEGRDVIEFDCGAQYAARLAEAAQRFAPEHVPADLLQCVAADSFCW